MNQYQSNKQFDYNSALAAFNQIAKIKPGANERWDSNPPGSYYDQVEGTDCVVWWPGSSIDAFLVDLKTVSWKRRHSGNASIPIKELEEIISGKKRTTHFGFFNGYVREGESFITDCTQISIVPVKAIIEEIQKDTGNVELKANCYTIKFDWIQNDPRFEQREMKKEM